MLVTTTEYTVWFKIWPPPRHVYTYDFGSFSKVLRIVGKSLPHPLGVFPKPPNFPKCHIRQTIKKINKFNNQIRNISELRLADSTRIIDESGRPKANYLGRSGGQGPPVSIFILCAFGAP